MKQICFEFEILNFELLIPFLFFKTAQELRLTEDVHILQDRVQHMEDQSRDRDGIEEDYRKIKEQV